MTTEALLETLKADIANHGVNITTKSVDPEPESPKIAEAIKIVHFLNNQAKTIQDVIDEDEKSLHDSKEAKDELKKSQEDLKKSEKARNDLLQEVKQLKKRKEELELALRQEKEAHEKTKADRDDAKKERDEALFLYGKVREENVELRRKIEEDNAKFEKDLAKIKEERDSALARYGQVYNQNVGLQKQHKDDLERLANATARADRNQENLDKANERARASHLLADGLENDKEILQKRNNDLSRQLENAGASTPSYKPKPDHSLGNVYIDIIIYGGKIFDDSKTVDTFLHLLKDKTTFEVHNKLFPADPWPLHSKTLVVVYSVDGKPFEYLHAKEGGKVSFKH